MFENPGGHGLSLPPAADAQGFRIMFILSDITFYSILCTYTLRKLINSSLMGLLA